MKTHALACLSLRLLLPALLLAAVAGCSDPLQRAADYASLAQSQLTAGDLDDARENVRRAILARDDVAEYYVLLGRIEMQAQRPASAFNAFSLALDLQTDNPEILQSVAELGLQTGRIREAKEAADRILLLTPNASRAMLVKGFIAIDDGRLDDAKQMATEILTQNPSDEGGTILSARIDALQGKTDKALADVRSGIAAVGSTTALNVTMLEIYRMQGNAKGMQSVFPEILKALGGNIDYRIDYINLLYRMGHASSARAEAVKAIQATPNNNDLYQKLSDLWLEYDLKPLGPPQIDYIAQSGTRAAQLSLARFHYVAGDYSVARRLLALPLSGRILEAQGLMARIRLAQGDGPGAEKLADEVLAQDPANGDALLVRSARHLAKRQIDLAIEDANIVVADAPSDYAGYVALAKAYEAKPSIIRARQIFERGMDALPQSRQLADEFQQFLLRNAERDRIVSLYRELALAKPSSISAWSAFSRACAQFGTALCAKEATAGMAKAQIRFMVDEPPGTPHRRGMFARITPDDVCASGSPQCTEK